MTATWRDFPLTRLTRAYLIDGIARAEVDLFEALAAMPLADMLGELAVEMKLVLGVVYGRGARDGATFDGRMDAERMATWLDFLLGVWEEQQQESRPRLQMVR